MTDKQIKEVFKNGFYCIEPCPEIKELQAELKRKEQECEELKKQWEFSVTHKMILEKDYIKQLDQLKSENKHLNDLLNQALKELEKARETLTEIKKIAEHCINKDICTFCDYSDKCYIEDEEIPTYDVCKLILQKISEVEDEHNG